MTQPSHPFASFLPRLDLCRLRALETVRRCPARARLFEVGSDIDKIYLVALGSIRLENEAAGSEIVFSFKQRGDLLGIFSYLAPESRHVASAVAIEWSQVLEYDRARFWALAESTPALEREVRRQVSANFRALQEDRRFARMSAPARLASVLLQLYESQPVKQNHSIPIPLSKADLARRIGAEPETVVRIFNEWVKKEIVRSHDKIVEIRDPRALRGFRD